MGCFQSVHIYLSSNSRSSSPELLLDFPLSSFTKKECTFTEFHRDEQKRCPGICWIVRIFLESSEIDILISKTPRILLNTQSLFSIHSILLETHLPPQHAQTLLSLVSNKSSINTHCLVNQGIYKITVFQSCP